MAKKVLFITYYWPPSGGPGVQRVLNFVKYLPQYGWEPIILTVENGEYSAKDHSLIEEIPPHTKVYKTKSFEPFSIFKLLTGKKQDEKIGTYILSEKNNNPMIRLSKWIRLNLFIPDARIGWKSFAVNAGKKIIKEEGIELILASSPPHSVQLIAKELAQKTGIPWVADFRDPWKEIVYNQNLSRTALASYIDAKQEYSVLHRADGLVSISKDIIGLLKSKCQQNKATCLIPNGYDNQATTPIENPVFTFVYTGVLSVTRIPHSFIQALGQLCAEGFNFKIELIGNICNEVMVIFQENGIIDRVQVIPYLPHNESINHLNAADALLLVIDNVPNNKGILTGKLFEYIGAKRPIFAVGNVDGEANKILQECDCGEMVDYKDVSGAYQLLKQLLNRQSPYRFKNASQYSREQLTAKLAAFMDEIVTKDAITTAKD